MLSTLCKSPPASTARTGVEDKGSSVKITTHHQIPFRFSHNNGGEFIVGKGKGKKQGSQ